MNLSTLMFGCFAVLAMVFAMLTVTARKIIHSATYLLSVLLCVSGIYFTLGYIFLGTVQLLVYGGGVIVLYVFSVFLTSQEKREEEDILHTRITTIGAVVAGIVLFAFIILTHQFINSVAIASAQYEISLVQVGRLLLSSEYGGMLLPFEMISLLLLACIVSGVVIARKH